MQRRRGPGGSYLPTGSAPQPSTDNADLSSPIPEIPPPTWTTVNPLTPAIADGAEPSPSRRAMSLPLSNGESDFFPMRSRFPSTSSLDASSVAPVLRSSCLRCYASNASRALSGEVAEIACTKARAVHLRCTLCAGKNKRCVRVRISSCLSCIKLTFLSLLPTSARPLLPWLSR